MKYVFPIILILLSLASCTGFEDGPSISFTAPETLMANEWAVREAIKRSDDITAEYASDVLTFEELGTFSYLESARIISNPPFTQSDTLSLLGTGTWDFLNGNDQIELLYNFTYKDLFDPNIVYEEERYEQWEILRLTETEFWLRNDSISLKLEPI